MEVEGFNVEGVRVGNVAHLCMEVESATVGIVVEVLIGLSVEVRWKLRVGMEVEGLIGLSVEVRWKLRILVELGWKLRV